MGLDRLLFEDPWAALVGLVTLLPLAAATLTARRSRETARALGLTPAAGRRAAETTLAVVVCALLALAAAQPSLEGEGRRVREDIEVVFVLDVSGSMRAAAAPGAPTRLERATAAVRRLAAAVPDVPAGVSGLTDRVLPYSFPSADRAVLADVLARSVRIDAPPPATPAVVATSFDALGELVPSGFFSEGARRRTCVVLTDGESRSMTRDRGGGRCSFHVIQVGERSERIFGPDGRPEPGYPPVFTDTTSLRQLAATTGARIWPLSRLDEAAAALRAEVGTGPTRNVPGPRGRSLAAFPAGAALALTALLAFRVTRRRRVPSPQPVARRTAAIR